MPGQAAWKLEDPKASFLFTVVRSWSFLSEVFGYLRTQPKSSLPNLYSVAFAIVLSSLPCEGGPRIARWLWL